MSNMWKCILIEIKMHDGLEHDLFVGGYAVWLLCLPNRVRACVCVLKCMVTTNTSGRAKETQRRKEGETGRPLAEEVCLLSPSYYSPCGSVTRFWSGRPGSGQADLGRDSANGPLTVLWLQ